MREERKNQSRSQLAMNHRLLKGCINASMSNGQCSMQLREKNRERERPKKTIEKERNNKNVREKKTIRGRERAKGMKVENSRWRGMDTSRARKRGRSLAQWLMDSGANLTVGGFGHVGLFFWWRWPTLPHKRLPRAAEYCIGCLKGLLQRRESILQREKERGRYERRWLQGKREDGVGN